jgi:flavin-binding protein dodecin
VASVGAAGFAPSRGGHRRAGTADRSGRAGRAGLAITAAVGELPSGPRAAMPSGVIHPARGNRMSNHVYKVTELVGSSPKSVEEAVQNAVARAGKTVRNMRWLEVQQIRGHLEDGKLAHWQVVVKIGFTLED